MKLLKAMQADIAVYWADSSVVSEYFQVKEVHASVDLNADMMTSYFMSGGSTLHRLAIFHVSAGDTGASGHACLLWEETSFNSDDQ